MPTFGRLLFVVILAGFSTATRAENWPQFRGPRGTGLPQESRLPTEWSADENIAWKAELPGAAWSQPIVWGDKIFVTTAVTENQTPPSVGRSSGGRGRSRGASERPGDRPDRPQGQRPQGQRPGRGFGGRDREPPDQVYRYMLLCLEATNGQVVWERLAHEGKPTIPTHRSNTYASETPVTDGERVYAYFGMTGLYCYDMDGKQLWKKDIGSYPMSAGWGTGSSPALDGDRLFVQCDNNEESFLVALDKRSGDELWRVPREEESNWSTPFVWKNKHRTELVTAGGGKMRAYDPSDGHLLWELNGVNGRCSATPVGTDELLYVGVGGGRGGPGPLVAIRAGAKGEMTLGDEQSSSGIAWSVPRGGPPLASPLVYRDCLYILDQRGGIVSCYDANTGQQHYKKRLEGARGFTASPWAYDGKVFLLDEDGQTFVLDAGEELKLLAVNKLDDAFWSSVAVAGDRLLLRGVNYLYCIGPAATP